MRHRQRKVVRALIVSPESRILLLHLHLGNKSIWITPGGGIEDQENRHTALQRELYEEIGRDNWDIGFPVWERSHTFDFEGETLTQHEVFYWVESEWFNPPETMPDAHENQYFGGFKWWTVEDIINSQDEFTPKDLGRFFKELLDDGMPKKRINVGV